MAQRSSHLCNRISYSYRMASLYWIRAQIFVKFSSAILSKPWSSVRQTSLPSFNHSNGWDRVHYSATDILCKQLELPPITEVFFMFALTLESDVRKHILTQWGQVTHKCVSKQGPSWVQILGLMHIRHQAITFKIQGQDRDENQPKSNQVINTSRPSILPKRKKIQKVVNKSLHEQKSVASTGAWTGKKHWVILGSLGWLNQIESQSQSRYLKDAKMHFGSNLGKS